MLLDIDKDGDEDLLIVGEWMTIRVLENNWELLLMYLVSMDLMINCDMVFIMASDLDGDSDGVYILET